MVVIVPILLLLTNSYANAKLNCQKENIKFEKIIGIRPPNTFHPLLLHQSRNQQPVTTQCITKCLENIECLSFVLFYKNSSCFWFRNEVRRIHDEEEGVLDTDVAWFQKTCYKERENCDNIWAFERVPGATLIGNNTKKLPKPMTRLECQQLCLNETTFQCRSAKFKMQQFLTNSYDANPSPDSNLGLCTLSNSDRHIAPNAYRVSSYDEEYFENQCSKSVMKVFCAFEEYDNVVLSHIDASYENVTKLDCQERCDKSRAFNCRGYSLIPTRRTVMQNQAFTCLIHSENSKLHGPKQLQEHAGAKYYERAPCLNISVSCTHSDIIVRFKPDVAFNGRMYMRGYSEDPACFAGGNNTNDVVLKIPLEVHKCGIIEARSPINRTLMSSTMILQYNSLVQTQADRIINVGCIFTNSTKVVVGTSFHLSDDHVGAGSSIVNTTTDLPVVEMRILDLSTNGEVSDTQIGDELRLVIEMTPKNSGIDIWAGHLVAMTENGQDSILLLDDRGCPTNLEVFPGLTKTYSNDKIKLSSTFQAFKFSSSNVIRFSVIVQFCSNKCPSVDCGSLAFSKRKRELSIFNSTTITNVNRTQFEATRIINEMPLEFVLIVRNANIIPDRLVYGENNKIIVAGFDYFHNEVCIDFSLLIGIVITWILIQLILLISCIILIKKYKRHYKDMCLVESTEELHKNFGLGFSNLETNRRVHFADGHLS